MITLIFHAHENENPNIMPTIASEDILTHGLGQQLEQLLLRNDGTYTLLLDLEEYLDLLAPIIRDLIKQNALGDLISKLNGIVKRKEEELNEELLNLTDDISLCLDTIDAIHVQLQELSRSLSGVSGQLGKLVHDLMARKNNLIKRKQVTSKINETTLVLTLCIQVLENTNKIHELIKQHKYFSAMKLIDELTNVHLPQVEQFSFSQKIHDLIPHLTRMIKDELFDNIVNWLLLNLERKIPAIGDAIYDNLDELQRNWEETKQKMPGLFPYKLNLPTEVLLREPLLSYTVFSDDQLQISLAPIYDGVLVYQTLNESELLQQLYNKEWMKKYNRVIHPVTLATAELVAEFADLMALDEYLVKIAAFFVMDKEINLATRFQLRLQANANDLWNAYVSKLKPVLLNYLDTHNFAGLDDLLRFKDALGDFLQVMELHGYRTTELYDVLMTVLRQHFAPILVRDFRGEFLDLIQLDRYMPILVDEDDDYETIMRVCWYKDDAPFAPAHVDLLPIVLPFSEDYVRYCIGIRALLEDVLQFIGQHYAYEINEIKNIVLNEIFERVLGDSPGVGIAYDIKEFISKNASNKEVVAQLYTNLEYYVFSLYELGRLIDRKLRSHIGIGLHNIDANDAFTLRAVDIFNLVRKELEKTIFTMVDEKIRALLDTVEYDTWQPDTRNLEANFFIKDFAMFLDNLFSSIFANLPMSIRTLGLFRTYDFVAEHFLDILKQAPLYNRIAIENFNLDVQYIEDSMRQLYLMHQEASQEMQDPEEATGSVALETTFTELRQCINLLLLDNYDEFIGNPSFRMRSFDRVRYEDGTALIGKMIREDLHPGISTEMSLSGSTTMDQSRARIKQFSDRFKLKLDVE